MSIAVRVSVWILGVLVVVSAAVAVLALTQKQTLQGQNQILHNEIADDQSKLADLNNKAKSLQDQADQLNSKVSQTQQEKAQVQSQYDDVKKKSDDLQSQLDQANADRDDWKNRVETITHERDDLMQKLKNQPVKIVYKDRIVQAPAAVPGQDAIPSSAPDVTSAQGDHYWASVLKQKAALQIEIEKEKSGLDQAALQVVGLKKQNSDLELELKQISNEKDEIVQKIKYGQDLADNLSIDLARSRNDQQAVNDRADKLKEENLQLLSQIRELNSTKLELEKNVSRLTDDKDSMQKKLVETESVIQSRIDDIWKIKQSLDKKLSENSAGSGTGGMELPPIIVNAPNAQQQEQQPQQVQQAAPVPTVGKMEGSIISINETNNFVIADLGQQNSAVSVGNTLKVYRNGNQVATLEVIQVRRDICAADIKDKSSELKVGDIVKFN
jgi:predicted  nucleic acid-binding Zn-ribbon protein